MGLETPAQRPPLPADTKPVAKSDSAVVDTLNQQSTRATAEIGRRSTAQDALQTINLTAAIAIAGLTMSGRGRLTLLLLLPP